MLLFQNSRIWWNQKRFIKFTSSNVSRNIIEKIYEIEKFQKFEHVWKKNLLTKDLLQTIIVITAPNNQSSKTTVNSRKTRRSFKKTSKFSIKWATNMFTLKKNLAEFFRKIKNIREILEKEFKSRDQSRSSFSSEIYTLSSIEQKSTILEKRSSKKSRTSLINTKRNRSSF